MMRTRLYSAVVGLGLAAAGCGGNVTTSPGAVDAEALDATGQDGESGAPADDGGQVVGDASFVDAALGSSDATDEDAWIPVAIK